MSSSFPFRPQAPPFRPFVPRGIARTEDSQPQESVAANRRHTVPSVRSTPYPMGERSKQGRPPPPRQIPWLQHQKAPRPAPSAPKAMRPSLAMRTRPPPPPAVSASVSLSALEEQEEEALNGGPFSAPASKTPYKVPAQDLSDEQVKAAKEAKKACTKARKLARRQASQDARASRAATAADEEAVLRVVTPPSPSPAPNAGPSPARSAPRPSDPLADIQPALAIAEIKMEPSQPPTLSVPMPNSRAASVPSGTVTSQPARLVSLQPTPMVVDLPDVKPDIQLLRRSPSPPAAPAPRNPKSGVASWTEAELPADCNLRGTANQPARDKARRQFRLRQTWELANERRLITRFKWISGGLALDWSLEKSHGTWTRLYPPEVRCATPLVRRRFLNAEVHLIEAKGWTVMLAEEKLADDGSAVGVSVAWLNDACEPSPSSTQPPSPRPSTLSPAVESRPSAPSALANQIVERAKVIVDTSLALPPSAAPPAATRLVARVKSEPMDVDNTAVPPPPARPPPTKSSHETPQLSVAVRRDVGLSPPAPPTLPALRPPLTTRVEPKAEPIVDADPMGNPLLIVSQAVAVSQRLQAVSNDRQDMAAIEAAQAEVRLLLSQAGAVLNRLGHMRDTVAECERTLP